MTNIQRIGLSILVLLTHNSHAWTIGAKTTVTGPAIHVTYFATPNNEKVEVQGQAYVGQYVAGSCEYSTYYDIGKELLKSGDYIALDAFTLKALIGNGYNCMSIFYKYKQRVMETFLLIFDNGNYIATYPDFTQVIIANRLKSNYCTTGTALCV